MGPTSINEIVPSFFEKPWLAYAAFTLFFIALIAFLVKTMLDFRAGQANKPKIFFILMTVVAFFFIPMLDNLDTALQGVNVWHCTQYLALTWYINRLREERGEMEKMPLIKRICSLITAITAAQPTSSTT